FDGSSDARRRLRRRKVWAVKTGGDRDHGCSPHKLVASLETAEVDVAASNENSGPTSSCPALSPGNFSFYRQRKRSPPCCYISIRKKPGIIHNIGSERPLGDTYPPFAVFRHPACY